MRRAAHQLYDEPPLVFADPLALRVLSEDARAEVSKREELERTPSARAMRAFLCARSRFAEDALERAVAAGVRQYVVLGAGLDTFAVKSALPERPIDSGLRIFEVDHPATLAGGACGACGRAVPAGIDPVELCELLRECGFARVEDLDGDAISARYFVGRTDGLTVRSGLGRLACAWRD